MTEKQANEILSLPVNQYISFEDIELICNEINSFFNK